MLVALVAIQAAALSIYVFEWFSPVGHNMKEKVFFKKYFSIMLLNCVWQKRICLEYEYIHTIQL